MKDTAGNEIIEPIPNCDCGLTACAQVEERKRIIKIADGMRLMRIIKATNVDDAYDQALKDIKKAILK